MFISDSDRWHVLLLPDSVFYNVQTAIYALFFFKVGALHGTYDTNGLF